MGALRDREPDVEAPARGLPEGLATRTQGGVVCRVRVIPRSGRSRVDGVRDGALLVRLAAAPVDGAANDALVRVLAEALGVGRPHVTIVAGERSRDKRVRLAGPAASIEARLAALLA